MRFPYAEGRATGLFGGMTAGGEIRFSVKMSGVPADLGIVG